MKIESVRAAAYVVPTEEPESDGTLEWSATTLVAAHVRAGGRTGFGYSYADTATARLIADKLAPMLEGAEALDTGARYADMLRAIRNLGRPGICSMAISAVDCALWDLKAKTLGTPLARLLGACRDSIPAYGSGGFTSYPIARLRKQLGGWAEAGLRFVKMKVGRAPGEDPARVAQAREAIGPQTALFVDANGACTRKQALALAEEFSMQGVSWFEEPVSSDDLAGLRLVRDRAPAGMAVSAGEYGYDLFYFRRMLEAGAVDVLQADATRCEGITGLLIVDGLCEATGTPLSTHCAPSLHAHPACAAKRVRHVEYFHDHARIEHMLFDGALTPVNGALHPDLSRPGLGLELKHADAQRFAVS